MTRNERELLQLIYREAVQIGLLSPMRTPGDDPREWTDRRIALGDLPRYGVRVRGYWLGSSAADRKARQRALQGLERAGLVTLHAPSGGHTTHVRTTAAGDAAVASQVGGDVQQRPTGGEPQSVPVDEALSQSFAGTKWDI